LGTFGVTIEQHLCCHSTQQENTADSHCTEDESCCDENEDCCDEIVSQVKIAKDFTAQDTKISLDFHDFALIPKSTFANNSVDLLNSNNTSYSQLCYYPPPENFQVFYCSFLI
jgi:hypothetical protein